MIFFPEWVLLDAKAPIPTRHEVWHQWFLYIRVISTIEYTGPDRGIEWHLSVSQMGDYPAKWIIEKVQNEFGCLDFELDDHGSAVAHLWLPVEKDKRGDCDCK